jgi:hypothetical protein
VYCADAVQAAEDSAAKHADVDAVEAAGDSASYADAVEAAVV